MQEMPFQRPKFQNISGGTCPRTPCNCVVTMASPSLKSWLRHCLKVFQVWHQQRLYYLCVIRLLESCQMSVFLKINIYICVFFHFCHSSGSQLFFSSFYESRAKKIIISGTTEYFNKYTTIVTPNTENILIILRFDLDNYF